MADNHLKTREEPSSEKKEDIGIDLDFGLKKLYKSKSSGQKYGFK